MRSRATGAGHTSYLLPSCMQQCTETIRRELFQERIAELQAQAKQRAAAQQARRETDFRSGLGREFLTLACCSCRGACRPTRLPGVSFSRGHVLAAEPCCKRGACIPAPDGWS